MSAKIMIEASDVWGYFQKHKEVLKTHMHLIAGYDEYGIEVFVTEDRGLPNIVVHADEVQVYEEATVSESDCLKTVEKIYADYLTNKVISILSDSEGSDDMTELEIEDLIYERESELDCAVYDFVRVALDEQYSEILLDVDDEICEDLKEHFLEYMARKFDLPIRRPMYLEYDDGTEKLEEYPYEHMEFEDEDNPIYKQ